MVKTDLYRVSSNAKKRNKGCLRSLLKPPNRGLSIGGHVVSAARVCISLFFGAAAHNWCNCRYCAAGQRYRGKVRFCLLHYKTCFANLAERFCFGIVNVPPVSYVLQCPDLDSVIAKLLCSQQKDSRKNCLWGPVYEIQDTGSAATVCMMGRVGKQKIGHCSSQASRL